MHFSFLLLLYYGMLKGRMTSDMKQLSLILVFCSLGTAALAGAEDTAAPEAPALPKLIYCSNGVYSLLEAASVGNHEVLSERIAENCNVNQKDELGNTALHLATRNGHFDCIKTLLKSGADTTITDAGGNTAAQLTKSKKALRLINKYMAYREEEMELCDRVNAGDFEALFKALKKKRFNPDILDRENQLSLLMLVCRQKNTEVVEALIKAGANVNFISPDSRSVLHKAVDTDHGEIIRALLKAGAEPLARAGNQATALHDAVWSNRQESIKALLPAYKEQNYSPAGGYNGTPINLAIDRGHAQAVQLFIDAGIDLNDNKNGEPPLIHAAAAGKRHMVELLLKAGADKNTRARNGKTARDVATGEARSIL